MKLDKIKFARVIGYFHRQFAISMTEAEMRDIDNLIDIEMPEPEKIYPKPEVIAELMSGILKGEKITAIKAHRALTGYGLKEAKDAVEANWPNNWISKFDTLKRIQDALGTDETGEALIEVARNAHRAEMELATIKRNKPATLSDILDTARGPVNFNKFEG